MACGALTPREQVPQAKAAYAPGGMRGCPHRWLDLPWWDGCNGTAEACEACWEQRTTDM